MATYRAGYHKLPGRRRKQRYALIERVIDFTNNLPVSAGDPTPRPNSSVVTTAWAANDVLEALRIRAGQTVLHVQVELLTASADSGDYIHIGYGSEPLYWGKYRLDGTTGWRNEGEHHQQAPLYFSSADTIDIQIKKAALQGKIRLVVHVLEDDR